MRFDCRSASRHRVIVDTDAKNEADDQFALVHALLSPSLEVRGVVAAHFGQHPGRPDDSMAASHAEVVHLLRLMDLEGRVPVAQGAGRALAGEHEPRASAGAQLIIDEALRDDPRPLHVLCLGPLTDMASALLMAPRLVERDVRVVWVGGAEGLTHYGPEFNLHNDVAAANVVLRSRLALTQIPYPLYAQFCVSHDELLAKVHPHGPLGRYLVEQLIEVDRGSAMARESRSLGDSPAVGVLLAPHAGRWQMQAPPQYDPATGTPVARRLDSRPIRVYESFDARFLLEDFFAKIARFARTGLLS